MSVNKPDTATQLGCDLSRVDAHVIRSDEYEELPELTDAVFARATLNKGGALDRRTQKGSFHCDCLKV